MIDSQDAYPIGSDASAEAKETLKILIIACGALAQEIKKVFRQYGLRNIKLQCLPASLHNRPEQITDSLSKAIRRYKPEFDRIYIAYADCGTGGMIDKIAMQEGVERLTGAHCYEFFTGAKRFLSMSEKEPATFYLSDFLAQHFDKLVINSLGINKHPQLMPLYFGHYKRLVYLAQSKNSRLLEQAMKAAQKLNLEFVYHYTGLGELEEKIVSWSRDNHFAGDVHVIPTLTHAN